MKTIEMEVPIKVEDLEFKVKHSYSSPESLEEVNAYPDAVRIFNTGLRAIERNKIKAEYNFEPLAKRLVDMKISPSLKDALDFMLKAKAVKVE